MSVHLAAARLATMLPAHLPRPAYRSLAESVRVLVVDGRIPAGTTMPSERDLVEALGVSRTTVGRAYDLLRDSGYLEARRGSGHVVQLPRSDAARSRQALYAAEVDNDTLDLTTAGTRAPAGMAAAYAAAAERLPGYLAGTGYLPLGVPELRDLIAQRYTQRGLPTSMEQVIVTSGAVAAMAAASRTLVRRGMRVVVDQPSYPNTLAALRTAGARLVPAPLRGHEFDADAIIAAISSGAQLAAVIPDFHNPTGALLSDADRARVAASLARAGATALVDETFCDVVLDDIEMPAPFAAHARDAVSVGSASKSYWGGLRLGWLRAPRPMLERLVEARMGVDPGAPVMEQLVLVELMRRSPTPSAERLAELRAARDATVSALHERLPWLDVTVPRGGVMLWLDLRRPIASALAVAAEQQGLVLASGPRFGVPEAFGGGAGLQEWVRLPFVLAPDRMREAVRRLALALDAVEAGGPTASPWRPLIA